VKAPPPTERQVQREILRMCGDVFPQAFIAHVPNGTHLSGNDEARARQMGGLKGDGLKVGFPDLIILWNHGTGFIEVKRPKLGKVSPVQEQIHAKLLDMGHRIHVVTSAIEAQSVMLDWGVPASGSRWREAA
jgi:hypothetical protein